MALSVESITENMTAIVTSRRWHSFRIIFTLGAIAVLLDLGTTQLGRLQNPRYEQNPLAGRIITGTGFGGTLGILALLGGVVYVACWWLAHRQAYRPLALANGVLAFAVALRVAVVVADAMALAGAVR